MRSAYAHCADPGGAGGQVALFTADTRRVGIRLIVNMFLSAGRRLAVERMRITS
jgi:hypothetical protein